MLHALEELNRSIELDPNNAKARSLLDDISYALPEAVRKDNDRYLLLWLTATPTPAQVVPVETPTPAQVVPTKTPTLAATVAPLVTPITTRRIAETPTPTANPKMPFCSSALLIPLGIGLVIANWYKRRKNSSK
jgi:carbohydrate-binding DOMON domain-containing protein